MDNVDLSVVIPTYNESESIVTLVERIHASFENEPARVEYLIVDDDSPDGTAEKAASLKEKYDARVIVRKGERGLATAVLRGFNEARGKLLAVIDADLQHPPDIICRLYRALNENGADMAVASRKVAGGGTQDWEFHRVVISTTATKIAKIFLPYTLFKVQDATTGCFLFKRECVDFQSLSPVGFKIFLEVLTRGNFCKPIEVPYVFNQRSLGKSKMTLEQDILFLYHLLTLGLVRGEIIVPIGALLLLIALIAYLVRLF